MSRYAIPFGKAGIFSLSNRTDDSKGVSGAANFRELFGVETFEGKYESVLRRFAGNDEERVRVFNELAADETIDLLIAMRGGYGVTRILEGIDFDALRESGKAVCGYSDVTALLLAAWKHGCTRLYHGPMIASNFSTDLNSPEVTQTAEAFAELLNCEKNLLPSWCRWKVMGEGECRGPLIPMNLTLLCALCGTDFMADLNGAILAVEDISAPAHDIDRKFNQLRQCGILNNLSGIIFGSFSDCEDSEYLPEILREYGDMVNGPSVCGFTFGHIAPSTPLPFGRDVLFRVSSAGWMELQAL